MSGRTWVTAGESSGGQPAGPKYDTSLLYELLNLYFPRLRQTDDEEAEEGAAAEAEAADANTSGKGKGKASQDGLLNRQEVQESLQWFEAFSGAATGGKAGPRSALAAGRARFELKELRTLRPPGNGVLRGVVQVGAMAKSRSILLPLAAALAAVALLGRAFVAPRAPSVQPSALRSTVVARRGAANSVPTGLVWPSPEAEEKLREVDGIKLYPTHAWADDMAPILPATKAPEDTPVIIGVAADSGCGKSTFLRRILGALGTEVVPGHTAIGDMMTVICLDDYHTNDRAGRKASGLTALDARENDFALMGVQIEALKQKKAVYKPIYNHDTGNKDPPELIEPNKVMVFEGLHPIYDEKARAQLDLGIYIDIVNDVKFAWKVQRDVAERGWTEEQVREDIEKRLPDFSKYVDPQKADADVVLRYEPSDQGLPYLKVKLIQKKGGKFPAISLKKDLELTGSKPGAAIKMYDDDWFGSPVTVVEMDGEIDMDNMEAQLKEIEENIEGLVSSPGELTEAMVKLKSSPGSQNGTGLLQTIIAMKVREIYEKLTA